MAVICAKCGEELLGAVNRCWRCGQYAVSTPDAAETPPLRRSPVAVKPPDVITATVCEEADAAADEVAFDEEQETTPTDTAESQPAEQPTDEPLSAAAEVATPQNPAFQWRDWFGVASLILALAAIGLGWLTPLLIIAAIAGIALGIAGVNSRRKGLAIFALLLCLVGVTVSSVRLAYDTFVFIRGESIVPAETLPEDDFFDPADNYEPLD